MTIDPKELKQIQRPIKDVLEERASRATDVWDDTGKAGSRFMVSTQSIRWTKPWLAFSVFAEELMFELADHGIVWDPARVEWSMTTIMVISAWANGENEDEMREVVLVGVNLDHPNNFTQAKP